MNAAFRPKVVLQNLLANGFRKFKIQYFVVSTSDILWRKQGVPDYLDQL